MILDAINREFESEAGGKREFPVDERLKKIIDVAEVKRKQGLKEEQASEKQYFVNLKSELQKTRAADEEETLNICEEKEKLHLSKGLISEQLRVQSELNKCRLLEEKLLKEADELKKQKESFEREWEELDLRRAEIEMEVKRFNEMKENFEKEKQAKLDYIKAELEAVEAAKQSISIQEKAPTDKNQMLQDHRVMNSRSSVSWFRKCTSKIFRFSSAKKTEPDAAAKHLKDSDLKPESPDSASLSDEGTSGNVRKRSEDDDYCGEEHSDSVSPGKRTKRSQEASLELGDTVENGKASSGGTRAVNNEDDLTEKPEASMVGASENGGSTEFMQNNENVLEDEDDDEEDAGIREKLWTFFTT